ncbi:major facilitator superfamily domain-containing protein [Armillaria nabsnona]|nr:major facilitator superfamily domain-containing protein [Armillaria nabsnona]
MFMETPAYWLMCLALTLQGVGSTMVWVVGLALLCDETPPELVGRRLGIAMSGLCLGALVGPPVGGGLYARFGFRGPFIFGITVTSASRLRSSTIEKPDNEIALETNDNSLADCIDAQNKKVSFVQVLRLLFRSHRALAAAFPHIGARVHRFHIIHPGAVIYSTQEPVISNHLNSVWGLNSSKVGLVLLASVIPTLFAASLSGWPLADLRGAFTVIIISLILSAPWYVVMIIDKHLALFITAFACAYFFVSGVMCLLTVELASVAHSIDGIGCAWTRGIMLSVNNLLSLDAHMYDHINKGWLAICLLAVGLLGLSVVVTLFYIGDKPVAQSFIGALDYFRL